MKKRRDETVLRPVHPNAGITAAYRKRLTALIDEMANSFEHWLRAAYRKNEPAIAQDATPAAELQKAVDELAKRWGRRFDDASDDLAAWFAKDVSRRSDAALRSILKRGGWSVKFKMTPAMRDVLKATVEQNVQLIKSIPQQYLTDVQGAVMRSVQAGRDLGSLTTEIMKTGAVTRRRAALIARSQNNMATAVLQRARQEELGIDEAIWLHSRGGKEPRPTHVKNTGKRYKISEGWFDPDPKVRRNIWPGELVNCFPADTSIEFAYQVEKAYRRRYCGELAEIVSDSGKTLRGTPNHPVLTTSGWCPMGALNERHDIVELGNQRSHVGMPESHKDKRVPTIAEIFDAVFEAGSVQSEITLGDDFHGDGIADGDVDIVAANRPLSFGRDISRIQRSKKFSLSVSDLPRPRFRFPFKFLIADLYAAASIMCSFGQPQSSSPSFASHPHSSGVASVANLATGSDNPLHYRYAAVAAAARQFKNADPLFVQTAKVVRVSRSVFDGHVYNLQTEKGWYIAQGIVSHNCRCVARPVIRGFS